MFFLLEIYWIYAYLLPALFTCFLVWCIFGPFSKASADDFKKVKSMAQENRKQVEEHKNNQEYALKQIRKDIKSLIKENQKNTERIDKLADRIDQLDRRSVSQANVFSSSFQPNVQKLQSSVITSSRVKVFQESDSDQ